MPHIFFYYKYGLYLSPCRRILSHKSAIKILFNCLGCVFYDFIYYPATVKQTQQPFFEDDVDDELYITFFVFIFTHIFGIVLFIFFFLQNWPRFNLKTQSIRVEEHAEFLDFYVHRVHRNRGPVGIPFGIHNLRILFNYFGCYPNFVCTILPLRSTNIYYTPPWTTPFDRPETINVQLPVSDSIQCTRNMVRWQYVQKINVLNVSHNCNILSHTSLHSIVIIVILLHTKEFANYRSKQVAITFKIFFYK